MNNPRKILSIKDIELLESKNIDIPDKELNDKRKGHRNPIVGGFSPFADMIIVNLHKLYVKYLLFMTI